MIDIRKWLDRVDNLLDVQKQLCIETISTTFTRRELIELIIIINEIAEISNNEREDKT